LRHRSGRTESAPAGFLAALPAEPLDGELWLDRGRFEPLSALVRRAEPRDANWHSVRYMVFDTPGAALPFEARLRRLARLGNTTRSALDGALSARIEDAPRSPIEIAPQWRIADDAALQRDLARTVAGGGEGLVLHVANAPYTPGRSDSLLKLKPHLDAEAIVVGHRRGSGEYGAEVGALEVENAEGWRFFVDSGLSDAARRRPPPVGSTITYRYRDLTSTGLPRFATFLRDHDTW
jgi:DNA ligase